MLLALALSSTSALVCRAAEVEIFAESQKLAAADRSDSANFGYSISLAGDQLVVGAYHDDAAYVFEFGGDERWVEVAKLEPIEGQSGAYTVARRWCGTYLQLIDERTCLVSDTVRIP